MTVLKVCYKHGVRFDEKYYLSKHVPLAESAMSRHGLKGVEMAKITATPDGSKPSYQVIFTAYFESPAALQNAMQDPRMGEVLGDIANYYDGMPDVLIGEVVALPTRA
ncbi:MAG: EthD family reductase [Candidatus Acidiferrales bacterium]|jgi:uncharacterized protein (TIGR02118 family)